MLTLKYIRDNSKQILDSLRRKQPDNSIKKLLDLDVKRRDYLMEVEALRAERNVVSTTIAKLKKASKSSTSKIRSMRSVSDNIKEIDKKLKEVEDTIEELIYYIPNLVHSSVPDGRDASENIHIREWGKKPELKFKIKDHIEIGEYLGLFDFKRAAKMAGAFFPLYTGIGAKLERALINFMLDFQVEKNGYQE